MKIIESIQTANQCYQSGKKITVKGLMLHSVGCPQPSASVFAKSWNVYQPNGRQVCVHAFVGALDDVYQCLPWNHRGWHGGGKSNDTHIGVEMTEPGTIKYTSGANWTDLNPENTKAHVMAIYKTATELFAFLCKQYNLDPLADGVIISHKEGCARGVASNHGDPEHMWGKYGLTMNKFRQDVKAVMSSSAAQETPVATTAPTASGSAVPYLVKVEVNDLSIRTAPGTNNSRIGYTGKGSFTIVEEATGSGASKWGLLKAFQTKRNGWISLDYAKKI